MRDALKCVGADSPIHGGRLTVLYIVLPVLVNAYTLVMCGWRRASLRVGLPLPPHLLVVSSKDLLRVAFENMFPPADRWMRDVCRGILLDVVPDCVRYAGRGR